MAAIGLDNVEVTRFIFAIVLLLASSHLFGYFFQRAKMPRVVGEIIGGLILGPTVLGYVSPQAHTWIFNAFETEGILLSALFWIGLILLMFVSGFEIQKAIDKKDRRIIYAILAGGTILPFIAGILFSFFYNFTPFLGTAQNMPALQLVIGIAIAVTSIPVISKILLDLNVMNTRFAKIVLFTATVEDILLFVVLAIATSLVGVAAFSVIGVTYTVIAAVMFFALGLVIVPKLIKAGGTKLDLLINSYAPGYALLICFAFAALAGFLNINIIFGVFLAGIVIGRMRQATFEKIRAATKDISLQFFIPIYFALVGINLDLIRSFDLNFFIIFLAFATLTKTIGVFLAAKFSKIDSLSSLNLAVAMNARGGPAIVLATVALGLGIINSTFYTTLVLLAIVTSIISGSWLRYILSKGWTLLK